MDNKWPKQRAAALLFHCWCYVTVVYLYTNALLCELFVGSCCECDMIRALSLSRNKQTNHREVWVTEYVFIFQTCKIIGGMRTHTGRDDYHYHGNDPSGVVVRLYGRGDNEMTLKRERERGRGKKFSFLDRCLKTKESLSSLSGETAAKQKK